MSGDRRAFALPHPLTLLAIPHGLIAVRLYLLLLGVAALAIAVAITVHL